MEFLKKQKISIKINDIICEYKNISKIIGISCVFYGIYRISKWIRYNKYIFNDKNERNKIGIIITGCDTGFGYELSKKLDKLGYCVIATVLHNRSIKVLNNELSNNSYVYQMNITKKDDIINVYNNINKLIKNNNIILFGIMNNAGIAICVPWELKTMPLDNMETDILFKSQLNVTRILLPLLYGRNNDTKNKLIKYNINGGRIVNMSSVSKYLPLPWFSTYQSCKSALSMWTHSLRMELYPFGIYTSVIEPHLFQTGIFTASKVFIDSIQSNQDKSILKAYNWKKLKNQAMKTNTKFENSGSISFDMVIDTCIHALTGKYPKRTYIVNESWKNYFLRCSPMWLTEFLLTGVFERI